MKIDCNTYPFNQIKDKDLLSMLCWDCMLEEYTKTTERIISAFKNVKNLDLSFEQAMDLWTQISDDWHACWLSIDGRSDVQIVEMWYKLTSTGRGKLKPK